MPAWAVWTALVVLWIACGSNFIALKAASEGLPTLALSALRLGAATLLLAPVAAWRMRRHGRRPTVAQFRDAALGGLLLLGSDRRCWLWD